MGSLGELQPPTPVPSPHTLTSIRTGKLKPLGSLSVLSGIIKSPRKGPIYVSTLGLTDDEHDLTFHGGPDKAIHQYCPDHYALWRAMYPAPETAALFEPGGFGENLIVDGYNESNVCIGDVVRIGPARSSATGGQHGVLLQVSLPRQPCYKLNQRFGIKGFAGKTHELNRTGWYYRVLEEGWIEEGMEVRLMQRKHPKWTIEKIHHHVHRDVTNREEINEALQIDEMGKEAKRYLGTNIKKLDKAEEAKRNAGKRKIEVWKAYKVREKRRETQRILAIRLEAVDQAAEATPIKAGSHLRLKLPNNLIRAYSVVDGTVNSLGLGIALGEPSRGGSAFIHTSLQCGDVIHVGNITEGIPMVAGASNHLFIVGGIGITAFMALTKGFNEINYNYEIHYAVRSANDIPFKEILAAQGEHITIYDRTKSERMDIRSILATRKWNSHIYACGPSRMMDEVRRWATQLGIAEEVHYEAFQGDVGGDPFTVSVLGREGVLEVKEEETLLEVLKKAGLDVQSSCEVGNCGTCRVGIREGKVEHRGTGLREEEKRSWMLSCCSRALGHIVVELEE
jgi:MOSC domain-containing protein YiiM/ferredoxin-NADP reductase